MPISYDQHRIAISNSNNKAKKLTYLRSVKTQKRVKIQYKLLKFILLWITLVNINFEYQKGFINSINYQLNTTSNVVYTNLNPKVFSPLLLDTGNNYINLPLKDLINKQSK